MKKKQNNTPKKSCIGKLNIPQNANGYPIKRVAFHRKVGKSS